MFATLIPFVLIGLALADRWLPESQKIRGVNLGSHFIVEPWMAGDTWKKIGCEGLDDEWSCTAKLTQSVANAKFKDHWNTWITQDDIKEIKSYGLNTIRVPVGFWINEDLVDRKQEYYPQGGLYYLDRLVGWAADAGLHVIIDLHGAPGSQSVDEAFTGHKIHDPQFYTSRNYKRGYQFLEWMTERIHQNNKYRTVGVLQVLNEPVQDLTSPSKAASVIKDFYPTAYDRIRDKEKSMGVRDSDQLKIQFMASSWGTGDPKAYLQNPVNLLFDDHKYYYFGDVYSKKTEVMNAVCNRDRDRPAKMAVGECSLGIKYDPAKSAREFSLNPAKVSSLAAQKEWYKSFWGAQAWSYERGGGWIFWAWKCDHINETKDLAWCYQNAVKNGIIPKDASSAAGLSPCK